MLSLLLQAVQLLEARLEVTPTAGDIVFGLELVEGEGGTTAFLVNHPERIEVPVVEHDGTTLVLSLPHYRSEIRARLDEGAYVGEWTKVRGPGNVARVPFRAVPVGGDSAAGPSGSIAGRWAVDFESDDNPAVGIFTQEGGRVRGTFLTATGDYRFLAGELEADRLTLSCFDGAHAFLFTATLAGDELTGAFHSGNWWSETWTARRDSDARVVDAFAQTTWDQRVSLADLSFPDTQGRLQMLGALANEREGLVLVLFGSWCPNCNDEAAYLVELDERYRARGLGIVGLAFELIGDFAEDARQVERYRARHGIEFPLLVAGTANKSAATEALGAVDFVRSYPTTIFLETDGSVRAIHSGYAGPATGEAHVELRREFEANIEELLARDPGGEAERIAFLTAHAWFTDVDRLGSLEFELEEGTLRAVSSAGAEWPVDLMGDLVAFGGGTYKLERDAGILTSALAFGARLTPPDSPTPLLSSLGLEVRDALASEEPIVRREAIVALALADEPVADVARFLQDEDLEVRIATAWAVGARQLQEGRAGVVELLTHGNPRLRREAATAVARLGERDRELLEALRALAEDPDEVVRSIVESALE